MRYHFYFLLFFIYSFFPLQAEETLKKIYISPGYWGQLFAIDNPLFNRDNCLDVLCQLRDRAKEAGYELIQADDISDLSDFEYLIVFEVFPHQFLHLKKYSQEKLILFLWEPPSVLPDNYTPFYHSFFSKVYTWRDDLVDQKKYFKFYYPVLNPFINEPIDFYWKRFSTLIACNKSSTFPTELYTKRWNVIRFFETLPLNDFDLYGRGWPTYLKNYHGVIDKKVDCLKFYKFCYCYENVEGIPGYVTEKIFDAFQAGCVPIYWGASNITDYIPKECFIHRADFASEKELYEFLKSIDKPQYEKYIENIKNYLKTERAKLYSKEQFIQLFMQLITNTEP